MIGCDSCDQWFHWSCVGIVMEPRSEEVWICSDCRRVKPVKKKKDVKETFISTKTHAVKKGPKIKTGSGLQPSKSLVKKQVANPDGSSKDSSKHSSINRTTCMEGSSLGWMCSSCKLRCVQKTCSGMSILINFVFF